MLTIVAIPTQHTADSVARRSVLGLLMYCAFALTTVASFQSGVAATGHPPTTLRVSAVSAESPLEHFPVFQQRCTPVRRPKKTISDADYHARRDEWAQKYTSVDSLRDTFGTNQNVLWGDLDPATARRLYKTLLPRALLELYNVGVEPEDLAPLAYKARVAAKLYARERCVLPARIFANLFDGFRQLKRYGSFSTTGMSYQQVWEKYAAIILEECQGCEGLSEEDVTAKVCLKILEGSCKTNEMIDKLVLSNASKEEKKDLRSIAEKLEVDVRELLHPVGGGETSSHRSKQQLSAQRIKLLRTIVKFKRRMEALQTKKSSETDLLKKIQEVVEADLEKMHEQLAMEEQMDEMPWVSRQSKTRNRQKPWINRPERKQ